MPVPANNKFAWTVIGLLAGLLIAGLPFMVLSLSKPDRSEVQHADEIIISRVEELEMQVSDLVDIVTRNTARIDFLIQQQGLQGGTP